MNEHLDMDNRHLDELLAEYTDRILSADIMDPVDVSTQDADLHSLEDTVALLKRAIADDEPSQATSERIRSKLVAEWYRSGIIESQTSVREKEARRWNLLNWSKRIPQLRTQRPLLLGFVALVILLLFALLLFSPEIEGGNLTATAAGRVGLLPVLLFVALVALAIAYWVYRSRR